MGIKASKNVESPQRVRTAAPLRHYRLTFSATVVNNSGRLVSSAHRRNAAESLADTENWGEYLQDTMRDAVEMDWLKRSGATASALNFQRVPCQNVAVLLKGYTRQDKEIVYSGVVEWLSLDCDENHVAAAAAWRIGDRMNQYGIFSEDENWWVGVFPETLTLLELFTAPVSQNPLLAARA